MTADGEERFYGTDGVLYELGILELVEKDLDKRLVF